LYFWRSFPHTAAMILPENSRRQFLRKGLTWTGAGIVGAAFLPKTWAAGPALTNPKSPDEALTELVAGNQRYISGQNIHHDYGPERPALVLGQEPFAIILGCADSRVSPELAFDQTRGRLFVVRLAGNFVDENGLASIEYGASVLGASLLMVLGHAECGAIKAAVDVATKGAHLPGHLPRLISHLTPSVEKVRNQGGSLVNNAIRENVVLNVDTLTNSKPILADLVQQKKLKVVGGLYDLATGRVEIFG
jgi:carbonic anhydrase